MSFLELSCNTFIFTYEISFHYYVKDSTAEKICFIKLILTNYVKYYLM